MAVDPKSGPSVSKSARRATKTGRNQRPSALSGPLPSDLPNEAALQLKEAILLAAEQSGEDCQGKGGLVGYLRRIANEDIKTFSGFLAKVLPLQVAGDPESPLRVVVATGIDRAPDEGVMRHRREGDLSGDEID